MTYEIYDVDCLFASPAYPVIFWTAVLSPLAIIAVVLLLIKYRRRAATWRRGERRSTN